MTDDPIQAGKLGLENIKRIAKFLPTAAVPYGEDYDLLGDAYNALAGQRVRELNHALRLVGGVVMTDYHGGRGGD
ncbi:zinc-dependent metalloprotease, partial [Salmonella enterica]|uniref:zinc-dependent metalloprotease n=1 Tax=Salmonella enterica TaxID=28901 RepID=UPI003D299A7A